MSTNNQIYNLEIDEALAHKFNNILSEESLMNAGVVSHQANNINNGTEENPDF